MDPFTQMFIEAMGLQAQVAAPTTVGSNVPVNVYETRTDCIVELNLAGYSREEVNATVNGRIINVKAESQSFDGFLDSKVHIHNFAHVNLNQNIELSDDLDVENIHISMADGLLRIRVPRLPDVTKTLTIEPHYDQHTVDDDGA